METEGCLAWWFSVSLADIQIEGLITITTN